MPWVLGFFTLHVDASQGLTVRIGGHSWPKKYVTFLNITGTYAYSTPSPRRMNLLHYNDDSSMLP